MLLSWDLRLRTRRRILNDLTLLFSESHEEMYHVREMNPDLKTGECFIGRGLSDSPTKEV